VEVVEVKTSMMDGTEIRDSLRQRFIELNGATKILRKEETRI